MPRVLTHGVLPAQARCSACHMPAAQGPHLVGEASALLGITSVQVPARGQSWG